MVLNGEMMHFQTRDYVLSVSISSLYLSLQTKNNITRSNNQQHYYQKLNICQKLRIFSYLFHVSSLPMRWVLSSCFCIWGAKRLKNIISLLKVIHLLGAGAKFEVRTAWLLRPYSWWLNYSIHPMLLLFFILFIPFSSFFGGEVLGLCAFSPFHIVRARAKSLLFIFPRTVSWSVPACVRPNLQKQACC